MSFAAVFARDAHNHDARDTRDTHDACDAPDGHNAHDAHYTHDTHVIGRTSCRLASYIIENAAHSNLSRRLGSPCAA